MSIENNLKEHHFDNNQIFDGDEDNFSQDKKYLAFMLSKEVYGINNSDNI